MNILNKMLEDQAALEAIREVSPETAESIKKQLENADEVIRKIVESKPYEGIVEEGFAGEKLLTENIFPRLCNAMIDNGITREAWDKADAAGRGKLLESACTIMLGSLMGMKEIDFLKPGVSLGIDWEVSNMAYLFQDDNLIRDFGDQMDFGDHCTFVAAQASGESYELKPKEKLFFRIPDELTYKKDLDTALQPLMLHVLLAAEQASLLRPDSALFDEAAREGWRQEIIDISNGVQNGECAGSMFESAMEMLPVLSRCFDKVCEIKGV